MFSFVGSVVHCHRDVTSQCMQIDDNGLFVDADGNPLDRAGEPIAGAMIDQVTGFVMNGSMPLGPDGEVIPDEISYPESITVGPDGVPRSANGTSPVPCGRETAECIGEPGSSITEFGILLDPSGRPMTRDGSALIGRGLDAQGFIMGPEDAEGNPIRLGPTGAEFPDDESLKPNVTLDVPDAVPRDENDMPLIMSRGGFVNADGLYFDSEEEPVNRDTGELLGNGTTVDAQGFLIRPDGQRIGPDGEDMPDNIVLPPTHEVTAERRPRQIDGGPIGERGAYLLFQLL